MVQLSDTYMTAGKSIALTIWTFVDNVASLLFNMLSWFFIALLPRIKCHLIIATYRDLERDFLGRTGSHDDGS